MLHSSTWEDLLEEAECQLSFQTGRIEVGDAGLWQQVELISSIYELGKTGWPSLTA